MKNCFLLKWFILKFSSSCSNQTDATDSEEISKIAIFSVGCMPCFSQGDYVYFNNIKQKILFH